MLGRNSHRGLDTCLLSFLAFWLFEEAALSATEVAKGRKKDGLETLQLGNSTQNAQRGPGAITTKLLHSNKDSLAVMILTVVTTIGLVLLILMTFSLVVGVWTQKKEKLPLEEDPESSQPPLRSQLLQEETYSCQFPQEVHGDKMMEERTSWKAFGTEDPQG